MRCPVCRKKLVRKQQALRAPTYVWHDHRSDAVKAGQAREWQLLEEHLEAQRA